MTLSIDVVIVAFERWDLTESCLRHLERQTIDHRTYLVDNGSTDPTLENVRRNFPNVHTTRLDTNSAFARACNLGVAQGGGEVIVPLNNDVDCRPDFLERLVAPLERDSALGSVVPLLLRPDDRTIDSVGLAADPTLAGFQRFHGLGVEHATDDWPSLAGPAGTAAAYRREAWEQAGGLDEQIFAYMEDFDLALRLRAAGWRTTTAIDAVGVHLGSATHVRRSAWQRRHAGFGRGYLIRRYGLLHGRHAARTLATEAIVVAGDLAISRDIAALRGRLAGWRAAKHQPGLACPSEAVDPRIRLRDSLRLRRGLYTRPQSRSAGQRRRDSSASAN
jgi:N-acetylglucosaminyl-diphospho-decaprenol L-rhamnosyltransferase